MFTDEFGQDDPLGLGLKGRARERRLTASLSAFQPVGGPLADPNWDAYLQSLDEQNVSGLQGGESAPGSKQIRGFGDQAVDRRGFTQAPLAGLKSAASLPVSRRAKPRTVKDDEADAYYQHKYPGLGY